MKSMLYMSLFWKIHKDYKIYLRENKNSEKEMYESLCKKQFNEYLDYLNGKNINVTDYFSFEDIYDKK